MANVHTTLSSLFTDIANAIRSKTGSTGAITADNFPVEIENLRTGFDYSNQNVTSIADNEFKNCTDLKSVDCYNLTSVGASAFENCANLKSVVLHDGVTDIGENAFKGCNCVIYCMDGVNSDGWSEDWNPDNCEVVQMTPVKTWGISATEEDNVVAKLYIDVLNDGIYRLVIGGSGNMTSYDGRRTPPWFVSHAGDITSAILYGITNIGSMTFHSCTNLTSITIPDSVTSIGAFAFYNCSSLTSITIPDSVTSIGIDTFTACSKLTSITIPDSVTSIGNAAFHACSSLTSITYTGTIAQWNAIDFSLNWNTNTGAYTIHCTDGDIAKS